MTKSNEFKRRKVFIQKAFQGRFISWVFAMILLAGACSGILLYLLLSSDLNSGMQSAHLRLEDTWHQLLISILISNIVAAIIAGLAGAVVVLHITHKIAGPLYRLQMACEEIGRGNLEMPTMLRSDDQLQEFAATFGTMVDALKARKQTQQMQIAETAATVMKLQACGDDTLERESLCKAMEQQLALLDGDAAGKQET